MAKVRNGITYIGGTNTGTTVEFIIKRESLGSWNMYDSGGGVDSIVIAHGLSATEWKTITMLNITIIEDSGLSYVLLNNSFYNGGTGVGGGWGVNTTNHIFSMDVGGVFDTAQYDSTTINRGWYTFMYIPD